MKEFATLTKNRVNDHPKRITEPTKDSRRTRSRGKQTALILDIRKLGYIQRVA